MTLHLDVPLDLDPDRAAVPPPRLNRARDLLLSRSLAALPGRVLDPVELHALVDRLAGEPTLWQRQVGFSDVERHFVSLHRDAHVDIWLLCWTRRNDTGWHDHDVSSGAVTVVQGALVESNPRIGGNHLETVVSAGTSFHFGPDHLHRLTGGTDDTVSIHAYSPPLWRLGQYALTPDGIMRRTSVSYADELRPLDDLPPARVGQG